MKEGTMQLVEPIRYVWTRDDYYRLHEGGVFNGTRVELIDGEIIALAAQLNLHMAGVTLVSDALRQAFGPTCWIRVQGSMDLTPHSVPDPDVAVVYGSPRNPPKNNPRTALLIVEVADSSLSYDRNVKTSLYAVSGILEYWILNVADGQLEVYRDPTPDPSKRFGWTYASRTDLLPGATVSPLALPGASIAIVDLLP
jgi:Uma2 family endonuclease